jgi:hypothetical protein
MNRERKHRLLLCNILLSLLLIILLPVAAYGGQGNDSAGNSVSTDFLNTLSVQERAWLRDHPVIRVTQNPARPPLEFVDAHGEPSGISEAGSEV